MPTHPTSHARKEDSQNSAASVESIKSHPASFQMWANIKMHKGPATFYIYDQ
jgi:hypothetical protein